LNDAIGLIPGLQTLSRWLSIDESQRRFPDLPGKEAVKPSSKSRQFGFHLSIGNLQNLVDEVKVADRRFVREFAGEQHLRSSNQNVERPGQHPHRIKARGKRHHTRHGNDPVRWAQAEDATVAGRHPD